MYLDDRKSGSTIFFKFTTVNGAGAPVALSSAGVTVYRNGSTVPDTTGVALTASFNGVTGLNHVTISVSSTGFYSSGGSFTAIVSSGAASESLVGYVLAHWTVDARPFASVSTAVSISTASLISTAQVIASVATVSSTIDVNVALWRGTAPSTLAINSRVDTNMSYIDSVALGDVGSKFNRWWSNAVVTDTVSTASTASITLVTGLSTDYDPDGYLLVAIDVTGTWRQARRVTGYTSTNILNVAPDFSITPSSDDLVLLFPDAPVDVGQWRGAVPSTLGTNAFLVPSSTAAILSVTSVGTTVQADVALWRGTAPSTLGTNAFLVPSSTAALLSVVSVSSAIVSSAVSISTASLISTAQTIASVNEITGTLTEPSTGPPQASPTPAQAWAWQHYSLRHQIRVNSSNKTFFNSSGGVLWTKGLIGDSATYIELIGATAT